MRAFFETARGVFLLVTVTACSSCITDAPYKIAGDTQPQQLQDGWEIATPEEVGISRQSLTTVYTQLLSEDQFYNATSFLIVKDGKLVFEAYLRGAEDRDRFTHVVSVTKSITSLLFGIAMTDGLLDSLDQTLYSIIPEKFPTDPRKQTITLRHLLTMTSGLSVDNDDFSVELFVDKPTDPISYFLEKPLYANPGELFYYRDVDPHLISYVIQRVTGKTEENYARERLFGPLGIWDFFWQADHTGTTAGAVALHLRPRDLAKIGQLALNYGVWNGVQVVDSVWISLSTRAHVETDHPPPPIYQYGYYWWVLPESRAYSALGHGGNFVYVVPHLKMVIAMTSMPDSGEEVGTSMDEFEWLIRPLLQ